MQDRKVIVAASEAAVRINNINNELVRNELLKDLKEGNFQRVQQELGVCVVPDSEFIQLKRSLEAHSLKQTFIIVILVTLLGSLAVILVPNPWAPCVAALWLLTIPLLKRHLE